MGAASMAAPDRSPAEGRQSLGRRDDWLPLGPASEVWPPLEFPRVPGHERLVIGEGYRIAVVQPSLFELFRGFFA